MKRIALSICIILIAMSPLLAFDGFTDIFGEPAIEESSLFSAQATEKRLGVAGSVSFTLTS